MGRNIRVAVKSISARRVDYNVHKRAAPPDGEIKILNYARPALSMPQTPPPPPPPPRAPGTNAEFHLVDDRIVGKKPKSLPLAQAAALPLTSIIAWELLFDRLGEVPGKSVDPRTLLITRREWLHRLDPDPAHFNVSISSMRGVSTQHPYRCCVRHLITPHPPSARSRHLASNPMI